MEGLTARLPLRAALLSIFAKGGDILRSDFEFKGKMMVCRFAVVLGAGLFGLACGGGDLVTEGDIRVDHAGGAESLVEATGPRSCLDDSGVVHAVWFDDRGGVEGVWYNRSVDGGVSWQTTDVQINRGSAAARLPDLACVGQNIYIVWEDHRDGELENGNIYVNYSTDSGRTFLAEDIALDADPDGENVSLAPRIAAKGNSVHVAWFDARNGAYDIYVNSSTDAGATWQPEPVRVDTDSAGSAYSASPVIAAGGGGEVVVAWEDSRDGYSDIYTNYSSDHGQSFSSNDKRLDLGEAGGADSFFPKLDLSDGHAYIVWHDTIGGEGREIYLAHSADGGASWDEAVRVESEAPGLHDALFPSVDALGATVYVAWQDARYGGYDIFLRKSLDGGATWVSEESRIDRTSEGTSHSYAAQVTAWADDTVIVLWEDRRSDGESVGFNDLFYNYSFDGAATWGFSDLRINSNLPGSAYAVDPVLMRNEGELLCVWADGRYGSSSIFFNSLAIGEGSVYIPPEE